MRKSKEEIIIDLQDSFNALHSTCSRIDQKQFNASKQNKWTPAENVQHIITGTKMTTLAFTLPKFIHVMLYGRPGRTSHGYSKLVDNYQKKLEHGATASGVYVPKKIDYKRDDLLTRLTAEGNKLVTAITNKWTEEQLDNYVVKHPILGLLTVRELGYFTIYHNGHHLQTVRALYL
jgi:hypothetical protein